MSSITYKHKSLAKFKIEKVRISKTATKEKRKNLQFSIENGMLR